MLVLDNMIAGLVPLHVHALIDLIHTIHHRG
jgi:hypothetical protein